MPLRTPRFARLSRWSPTESTWRWRGVRPGMPLAKASSRSRPPWGSKKRQNGTANRARIVCICADAAIPESTIPPWRNQPNVSCAVGLVKDRLGACAFVPAPLLPRSRGRGINKRRRSRAPLTFQIGKKSGLREPGKAVTNCYPHQAQKSSQRMAKLVTLKGDEKDVELLRIGPPAGSQTVARTA